MKELEIGETLTIRCVESKGNCSQCNECAFMEKAGCDDILCWKGDRKDGKNVHYEIVSDKEVGSDELIRMAHEDFDMLKEKGKEGEWADEHPNSPWISVKDRLPKEGQLIAYAFKVGNTYGTIFYPEPPLTDIMDFWMPLPELSEED